MQEHTLTTPRTARYFTLGVPERANDLWFVCHGYGQLAARFLERFRPIETGQRCIVAPEGLSRFYLSESPSERRVGASWMTREDRLHEIDDYVRYLDAVYGALQPRAAKVTVLGFSQGTATACRWAALGSARIDRLILWGGEVPPDRSQIAARSQSHPGLRESGRILHAQGRCGQRSTVARAWRTLRLDFVRGWSRD